MNAINRFIIFSSFITIEIVNINGNLSAKPNPHYRKMLADIDNGIFSAIDFLKNYSLPNGQFVYKVYPNSGKQSQKGYNIVRHAGTIYSIALTIKYLEERISAEDLSGYQSDFLQLKLGQMRQVLRASIEFLLHNSISGLTNKKSIEDGDLLAVWTMKGNPLSAIKSKAKLGASGLALVAFCEAYKVDNSLVDLEIMKKLANFIIFMQKENGGFFSRYYPTAEGQKFASGRDDSFTSLYYPGETALGLVLFHEITGEEKYLMSASKALQFLAESRQGKKRVELDHWSLIATKHFLAQKNLAKFFPEFLSSKHLEKHSLQVLREIYYRYLEVRNVIKNNKNDNLLGCLSRDGRVCPTATSLEGLLASMSYLSKNDSLKVRSGNPLNLSYLFEDVAFEGIEFLLRWQFTEGKYRGGWTRAVNIAPDIYDSSNKAEFRDSKGRLGKIRIDYVQHSLSALLAARKILAKK